MQENLKTVKEIFEDYKENSIINLAKIERINIFKKDNKLEIDLKSNEFIEINELLDFENYLKIRFGIETVEVDILYNENAKVPTIRKYMERYS